MIRQRLFGDAPLRPFDEPENWLPNAPQSLPEVGTGGVFGSLTFSLAQAFPERPRHGRRIQADLVRAGCYHPRAYQSLCAIRYVAMMSSVIVFGTMLVLVAKAWESWCVFGLTAGMLAGCLLPVCIVRDRAVRRARAIQRALPDLVELTEIGREQGLTVMAALDYAARHLGMAHPELAEELAIVSRQAKLGSLEQALDGFRRRTGVPGIRSLATLLAPADR